MKAEKLQVTKSAGGDISWRKFPQFEELLSHSEPSALLAKVEKTCRQLNDVLQVGSAAERMRARLAMTAYGRSLDLLRVLTEIRDKAALGSNLGS